MRSASRAGNGLARRDRHGKRQRGGEGHDAAHSGPGQDKRAGRARPARGRRSCGAKTVPKMNSARTATRTRRHGGADADQTNRQRRGDGPQEQGNFEAHDDEDESVQEEGDRLPHGAPGQPRVGAHDARAAVPEVQAGGDRRDHSGGAEPVGRKKSRVRGQERDGHFNRGVLSRVRICAMIHPTATPMAHAAQHRAGEGDDGGARRERARRRRP